MANGLVLGVNVLADGKANTAVEDISREFEQLRRVAEMLGLPNAKSINWILVQSSTSDSAATQKCMNKIIEEQRQTDEKRFRPPSYTVEILLLIENFCLGVNLRKAFLNGTMTTEQDERYHKVDTFVHEFLSCLAKLEAQNMLVGHFF